MQISTNFHGFYLIFTQFSIKTRIFYCILFSFQYKSLLHLCKTNKSAFDFFTKSRIGFQSHFREDSIFRQKATNGFVFRSRESPPKRQGSPSLLLYAMPETPKKILSFFLPRRGGGCLRSRRRRGTPPSIPISIPIPISISISISISMSISISAFFVCDRFLIPSFSPPLSVQPICRKTA